MMKILVADPELCTGCRLCEMVCSVKKEGVSDPSRSRIRIIKWEAEGFYIPMFCQQCEEPVCSTVCPVNAIEKNEETGKVTTNLDLCVGCRSCLTTCPLGGLGFDCKEKKMLRCDQCDGDPACVKYCDTKAIQYVESEKVQPKKMRAAALKLYRALKEV